MPQGQQAIYHAVSTRRPTAASLIVERDLADRLRELEARQDELSERLASVPADIPDVRASDAAICRRLSESLPEPAGARRGGGHDLECVGMRLRRSIPNIRAKLPQGALDRDRKCSLSVSSHNVYLTYALRDSSTKSPQWPG